MATIICGNDGRSVYADVLTKIRLFGTERPSRNGVTRDLGHTTIVLDEPFDALPIDVGRNVNPRIAAAEAIQLVGAFSEPEWLVDLAPQMSRYREPDGVFWGAYGARIGWQIRDVVEKLERDPWTRQAVVTLWEPAADNEPDKLDYPCTVALGFTMKKTFSGFRQLDMNVTMRSNDAWLGLPYDMFQFTQLQHTVARILEVKPGQYRHTAWSMHLYERDLEASHDVVAPERSAPFDPTGFGESGMKFIDVLRRARTVALSHGDVDWKLTESERWYRDVIHGATS